MKTITIHMTWKNSVQVEVDDDFVVPTYLDDFPEDVLEQMTSQTAELIDWE